MSEAARTPALDFVSWSVEDSCFLVRLGRPCRAAGWAPWNGGVFEADAIVNYRVPPNSPGVCDRPRETLRSVAAGLGLVPERTVGLMTGAPTDRTAVSRASSTGVDAIVFATAGLSNALRVGDPATAHPGAAGTVNVIGIVSVPLVDEALIEGIHIVTEAKTTAVLELGVTSSVSGLPATGTGTDCITLAAPVESPGEAKSPYAGKHVDVGEVLGRASFEACREAVGRAIEEGRVP